MTLKMPPAIWFWIVAVFLLLWNLAGLAEFCMEAFAPEILIETMDAPQIELFNSRPEWYLYNFAVAVIAGTLSCILIIAHKKLAVPLAVLSLLAVLISSGYNVYAGALDRAGTVDLVLFIMVIALDILLVVFAMYAAKRRWIV